MVMAPEIVKIDGDCLNISIYQHLHTISVAGNIDVNAADSICDALFSSFKATCLAKAVSGVHSGHRVRARCKPGHLN